MWNSFTHSGTCSSCYSSIVSIGRTEEKRDLKQLMSPERALLFHLNLLVLIHRHTEWLNRLTHDCWVPLCCAFESSSNGVSLGRWRKGCLKMKYAALHLQILCRRCWAQIGEGPQRFRPLAQSPEYGGGTAGRGTSVPQHQCLITPHPSMVIVHQDRGEGLLSGNAWWLDSSTTIDQKQRPFTSHLTQIAFGWSHKLRALAPQSGEGGVGVFYLPNWVCRDDWSSEDGKVGIWAWV